MSHNWVLSSRSRERLAGVKPDLADTVKRALELSPIDFGVSEGKRTLERQKLLVSQGASQTMKSKHLTGDAAGPCGLSRRPCVLGDVDILQDCRCSPPSSYRN